MMNIVGSRYCTVCKRWFTGYHDHLGTESLTPSIIKEAILTKRKVKKEELYKFADNLRKNMTPAEKFLWERLQHAGFLTQVPMLGYVLDFYHPKHGLIVEVDGSIHDLPDVVKKDDVRDRKLTKAGFAIFRFTNEQVFDDVNFVIETILKDIPHLNVQWGMNYITKRVREKSGQSNLF